GGARAGPASSDHFQETTLMNRRNSCPDCEGSGFPVNRREFVRVASSTAAALAAGSALAGRLMAEESARPAAESTVKKLYDALSPAQKEEICFAWDYSDDRGLLRTH